MQYEETADTDFVITACDVFKYLFSFRYILKPSKLQLNSDIHVISTKTSNSKILCICGVLVLLFF